MEYNILLVFILFNIVFGILSPAECSVRSNISGHIRDPSSLRKTSMSSRSIRPPMSFFLRRNMLNNSNHKKEDSTTSDRRKIHVNNGIFSNNKNRLKKDYEDRNLKSRMNKDRKKLKRKVYLNSKFLKTLKQGTQSDISEIPNEEFSFSSMDDSDMYLALFGERPNLRYWNEPLYKLNGPPYDHYRSDYFPSLSPRYNVLPPARFTTQIPPVFSYFPFSDFHFFNASLSLPPNQRTYSYTFKEDPRTVFKHKQIYIENLNKTEEESLVVSEERMTSHIQQEIMKNKTYKENTPIEFENPHKDELTTSTVHNMEKITQHIRDGVTDEQNATEKALKVTTLEPYFAEDSEEMITFVSKKKLKKERNNKSRKIKRIKSISHHHTNHLEDHPFYHSIPKTSFTCRGREPGMYTDYDAHCQVWHTCESDTRHHSFLCPNGTAFSQSLLTCDWWYKVDCDSDQSDEEFEPKKIEEETTTVKTKTKEDDLEVTEKQMEIDKNSGSEEYFFATEEQNMEEENFEIKKRPLFQEFVPYEGNEYPMFRLLSTRQFAGKSRRKARRQF